MSNEKVKIGIALAAGLCIGGGIGYVVAEKRLRTETEEEIASVKDLFRRLRDEDAAQAREDWQAAPVNASEEEDHDDGSAEDLAEEVVKYGYGNPATHLLKKDPNYIPPTDQELGSDDVDETLGEESDYVKKIRVVNPHRNVDPDDVTQWDRNPEVPYVVTEAEYRIDHPEFEKLTITYYSGDDTLADERDQFIPDPEGTVGIENLQYFGLASGDERVLHIRNERVEADFEVILNEGSYAREVLGFGIEESMLKESKKSIKKMRPRE